MEITWLGHSCFRLRTNEVAVITDPFPDSIGLHMGRARGFVVTVSHQHDNHSYWQGVGGGPQGLERSWGVRAFGDLHHRHYDSQERQRPRGQEKYRLSY